MEIYVKCFGIFPYIQFDYSFRTLAVIRLFLSISRLACRYANERARAAREASERASNYGVLSKAFFPSFTPPFFPAAVVVVGKKQGIILYLEPTFTREKQRERVAAGESVLA